MKRGGLALLFFFAALPVLCAVLPPRTISTSRQFAVYGFDATQRSAAASIAEETKSALLQTLGLRDDWKAMIVVLLRRPTACDPGVAPRLLSLAQTGTSLKIQLELLTGEGGRGLCFRDEIVRALLAELAYRESSDLPVGAPFREPPPWLVEGLAGHLDALRDDSTDAFSPELFQTLLNAGAEFDPFAFLTRDPRSLDATSRQIFRAAASGLVRLLLRDLPGGRAGLLALLRALPEAGRGAVTDLPYFCPELAQSPDGLRRWWTIGLARASAPDPRKLAGAADSDCALGELIAFPAEPPQKTADLTEMPARLSDRKKRDAAVAQLAAARSGLIALQARAHPSVWPHALEALRLVDLVLRRKTGDLPQGLRALAAARTATRRQLEGGADYLNWFEATQLKDLAAALGSPRRELEAVTVRPDKISEYLNAMEAEVR